MRLRPWRKAPGLGAGVDDVRAVGEPVDDRLREPGVGGNTLARSPNGTEKVKSSGRWGLSVGEFGVGAGDRRAKGQIPGALWSAALLAA